MFHSQIQSTFDSQNCVWRPSSINNIYQLICAKKWSQKSLSVAKPVGNFLPIKGKKVDNMFEDSDMTRRAYIVWMKQKQSSVMNVACHTAVYGRIDRLESFDSDVDWK